MITTKKLLVTLIASVMLSLCFGAIAYASETEIQPLQSSTEASGNTDGTINTQNSDTTSADGLIKEDLATVEETPDLEEGYFIDEQGEVFYEEPDADVEDLVIEDVADDTEVIEEEEVVEKPSYSEKDLRLLSCLIYAEAGNQTYEGMLAVANVVLNRVKSDVYWHVKTIEEVIYDHKWSVQFSVTIKNKKTGLSMLDKALKCYDNNKFSGSNPEAEKKAMNKAIKAAKAALKGKNNIGNYLCFTNKRASSGIKKKYPDYKILGDHIFYRTK